MNPEKDTTRTNGRATPDQSTPEISGSFSSNVSAMLRCGSGLDNGPTQDAAENVSLAIHASRTRYNDIQKGKALAGVTKLALGTYEEGNALDNACRVSGLSRTLGAVVYSLSAVHGPAHNLFLVSEGLFKIDRQLTASVLAEVARHDPSEDVRELALQWLSYSLPSKAANLVAELSKEGALTPNMNERYQRDVANQPIEAPGRRSILSLEDRQTVGRILPAIQQVTSGTSSAFRVRAIDVLAEEQPLYAIPMLVLAAQVFEPQVREAALTALAKVDPETANMVRDTRPSFVSRIGVNPPPS